MSRNVIDRDAARETTDFSSGWEAELRRALRGLQFGSVEVIVHDSRIVQIVRTEKFRVDAASEPRRTP